MLCLARAAFGLGQAGAFPTASAVVGRWIPAPQRGKASGFVALGGRIGGAIVPILSAVLLVAFLPVSQVYTLTPEQILNVQQLNSKLALASTPNNESEHVLYISNRLSLAKAKHTSYTREHLAQGFSMLINDPFFFDAKAFNRIKSLDNFASEQIERLRTGENLSERNSQRLNRHLLEAVFPEEIEGLYVASWRPVVFLFAALGLIVAIVVWFVLRDYPGQHPLVSASELALIGGSSHVETDIPKLPLMNILRCRSVWMSGISQFCVNIGWVFIVTWFVDYLMEVHQVAMSERSDMIAIPLMVGFVGMLIGGVVTDKLAVRIGLRFGRSIPWSGSMIVAAACFLACPFLDDPWSITWAMALVALSVDFSVPSMWAFTQDVGGPYVGVVLGFGNMFGNFGAAVSPILLANVQEVFGWDAMFQLCGGIFLLAALAAYFVDASKPVELVEAAEGIS